MRSLGGDIPISVQESPLGSFIEVVEQRCSDLSELLRRDILLRHRCGHRYVVQRTEQSGHIAQRACLGTSLLQLADRLAFEVDNVGVPLRNKNLPEVEVAMNARQQ